MMQPASAPCPIEGKPVPDESVRLTSSYSNVLSPLTLRQFIDMRLCKMFPQVFRHVEGSVPFTLYYGMRQKWSWKEMVEWKVLLNESEPLFLQLISVTADQRPDIAIENTVVQQPVHSLEAWRVFEHKLIDCVHRPAPDVLADWVPLEPNQEEA